MRRWGDGEMGRWGLEDWKRLRVEEICIALSPVPCALSINLSILKLF